MTTITRIGPEPMRITRTTVDAILKALRGPVARASEADLEAHLLAAQPATAGRSGDARDARQSEKGPSSHGGGDTRPAVTPLPRTWRDRMLGRQLYAERLGPVDAEELRGWPCLEDRE